MRSEMMDKSPTQLNNKHKEWNEHDHDDGLCGYGTWSSPTVITTTIIIIVITTDCHHHHQLSLLTISNPLSFPFEQSLFFSFPSTQSLHFHSPIHSPTQSVFQEESKYSPVLYIQ